jgi:hypothetical protein
MHNSGASRRENMELCLTLVIARSTCDEAIHSFFVAAMDCFAEPVIGRRFAPTRWLAMTPRLGFPVNGGHGAAAPLPTEAYANVASTFPSPFNSITTLSPAFSQIVFTRLPVSTISPARRPLPSVARWLASQASAL